MSHTDPTPAPLPPGLPPALADRVGARLLLVEDDEINREVAMELLGQAGMRVEPAENGREALDRLRQARYDLILMDLQMPVLDGLAATAEIRRMPECQALPIVAMTANTLNGERTQCLALGMNDFLEKPIEPDALWAALIRWLPARAEPSGQAPAAAPAMAFGQAPSGAELPGLDVPAALRRLLGNQALYLDLLRNFIAQQGDLPARIRAALDAADPVLAQRLAHTGKSLAGNIGSRDLQDRMSQVEAALRAHAPRPALEQALDALARALDQTMGRIRAHLLTQAQPPLQDHRAENAPPLLEQGAMADKETVLVVDDSPDNLNLIHGLLHADYKLKVANNGETALAIAAASPRPDLILLDIMMPGMDGFEVCRRLKAHPATRNIPVIFLTALNAAEDEEIGLELGAVDYITKPISGAILKARVRTHLNLKASTDLLKGKNLFLIREVAQRTRELETAQDVTILAMASLAETRDNETGNHIRRTQAYVKALARRLQQHPQFSLQLTDANIDLLFKSAPLHDIGKVGIPDHILLKPGRLTPEEFEIMKTHTTLGRAAIEQAEQQIGGSVPFLAFAKEIAYAHQEKWDGSGYPEGLAGDAIPVSARLMAVADVYDALISRRVYKPPMPHDQAMAVIVDGRGRHFDPDVVDAFLQVNDEFRTIAARFDDVEATPA